MVKNPNIIIFGQMGAGKSTLAKLLQSNYGYEVLHLGEKIHSECRLHGSETREEMQQYGQAMRNIFGQDVWCNYLMQKIETEYAGVPVVIDDGRQINELVYFKSMGFITLGIKTNFNIRYDRLSKRVSYKINEDSFYHETEVQAGLSYEVCKYQINNNGSLDDLIKELLLFAVENSISIAF